MLFSMYVKITYKVGGDIKNMPKRVINHFEKYLNFFATLISRLIN